MVKMRSKFQICIYLTFLLLLLQSSNCTEVRSVYVITHEWCRKCDKVVEIMEKIQNNFDKIYLGEKRLNVKYLHSCDDFLDEDTSEHVQSTFQPQSKQIYAKINQKYEIPQSKVPFPTIFIQCPDFDGIYQNQLTYLQIQYWINLFCYSNLPQCHENEMKKSRSVSKNRQDYQFSIWPAIFMNQYSNLLYFQQTHPFVKICLIKDTQNQQFKDLKLPQYHQSNLDAFTAGPLFFSSFTHNLRNYLFNPLNEPEFNKLAVFMVFNSASHPKVHQFIQLYKFISDRLHGDKEPHINEGKLEQIFNFNQSHKEELDSKYHQSSIKNYQFSSEVRKEVFKNLVFVGACYSDSKRDCMMKYEYSVDEEKGAKDRDPTQKPKITNYQIPYSFGGSKRQNLKRLMEFANLRNRFEDDSLESLKRNHQIQIIALHFDRQSHSIKGYEFEDVETNLGNDFLFWLQNVYNHVYSSKKNQEKKQNLKTLSCLSSEVVHVISERNLTTIKHNVNLKEIIDKFNQLNTENIKISTIIAEQEPEKMQQFLLSSGINAWSSEYFKYCLKDQTSKYMSYNQIIQVLQQMLPSETNKKSEQL